MTKATVFAGDQAAGLRRLFDHNRSQIVPVVANVLAGEATAYLHALACAFIAKGARVLVVDAADTAPAANEWLDMDIGACVRRFSDRLAYLAAPGAARRYVDARGSARGWLWRVQSTVLSARVVLVHASARDLARLIGADDWQVPVLLCGRQAQAITEAYTQLKLIAARCGHANADLLVGVDDCAPNRATAAPTPLQIAKRLDACADTFLGGSIRMFAQASLDLGVGAGSVADDLLALATLQLQPQVSASESHGRPATAAELAVAL